MKKLLIGGLVAVALVAAPHKASASVFSDFFGTIFSLWNVTPPGQTSPAQKAKFDGTPTVSNVQIVTGAPIIGPQNKIVAQQFTVSYLVTAGNDPIYISKNPAVAVSSMTNIKNGTVTSGTISDSDPTGDGADYFYIPAGGGKNFVLTYLSSVGTSTSENVVASQLLVKYGTSINNTTTGSTTQMVNFGYTLTAGNTPIYVSKKVESALTFKALPSGLKVTPINFTDTDTTGDSAAYFYIAPGQSKNFDAAYTVTGLNNNGGVMQVASINYGTSQSDAASKSITGTAVQNSLKALLFH